MHLLIGSSMRAVGMKPRDEKTAHGALALGNVLLPVNLHPYVVHLPWKTCLGSHCPWGVPSPAEDAVTEQRSQLLRREHAVLGAMNWLLQEMLHRKADATCLFRP